MRLINTRALQIEEFVHPPSYAILSHCWGENEVSFKEYNKGKNQDGTGYKKIRECCDFARSRGQRWVWIDTCCIDKRSSAELSEAINSMYRWYEAASECYAYLADVSSDVVAMDRLALEQSLERSRWFTRGWTLQELIAPNVVVFLASDWTILGKKRRLHRSSHHIISSSEEIQAASFVNTIAEITGLPMALLRGGGRILSGFPAGNRLSWLSARYTTRPEDLAYCMLGLLEINLPSLYGEGRVKAFKRIQLEVLRLFGDKSVFWCQSHQEPGSLRFRYADLLSDSATRLEGSILGRVFRMGTHDRPPLTISSDCIEMRMTHGRPGIFYHHKDPSLYVVRLNCISKVTNPDGSPCVIFVTRGECRSNHFIRVGSVSGCTLRGPTKDLTTEDDIDKPIDWLPRESDETMYVHLQANDTFTCMSDEFTNDVVFRLSDSNRITNRDDPERFRN